MIPKGSLLTGIALLLCAQSIPSEPAVGTDGQYHPMTEGAFVFDCGSIRAELKYRQERLPLESVASAEESLRVTMLELSVSGQRVSASDLEIGRGLFRSFAWIHRVDASCYAGHVTISVNGMPLRPFIASLDNRVEGETPELRTRTIRLSEAGIVHTS